MDLKFSAMDQAINTFFLAAGRRKEEAIHTGRIRKRTTTTGSTWTNRVRNALNKFEATQAADGTWTKGTTSWRTRKGNQATTENTATWIEISTKIRHEIREVWRKQLFFKFTKGPRKDAQTLGEAEKEYDEKKVRTVRYWYTDGILTRGQRSILTGGPVSLMTTALWRRTEPPTSCKFCGEATAPGWHHLAWECMHPDMRNTRPELDPSTLTTWTTRWGWPPDTRRGTREEKLLQHLATVRDNVLQDHFGEGRHRGFGRG